MGGFLGGGNAAEGISVNVNERNQRLQEWLAQQSARSGLDQRAIINQLVGGGPFVPGQGNISGQGISGFLDQQPTGPAYNLAAGGLQTEEQLSGLRNRLAEIMLNEAPGNLYADRRLHIGAADAGFRGIGTQEELLNRSLGAFDNAQGLNNQLTGSLGDFFSSGGAASDAQQQNIGDIFNAQREIGTSNLNQQFNDRLFDLREHADRRGLRFGDTPIQDSGNRLSEEYLRNLTNLELGLGGQESAALLNEPFRQATLGGQLQGQSNNQMLNLIQSFSQPITTGFNSANQLGGLAEFGAQFAPGSFAGPALTNFGALIGANNPSQVNPVFNQAGIAQNPTFAERLGSNVASSLGAGLGEGASLGASSLIGGLSGGLRSGSPPPATSGLNLPPGVMQPLTPF